MAQDMSQDRFDVDCLRHIATDPDAERISLAAAMIKLHALAIARNAPGFREDALEIVRYSRELYAGLPDKRAIAKVLDGHPASGRLGPRMAEDLVDTIWDLFRRGRAA